ncbi:hypothetical protein QBC47DRAFT_389275 [Echria macrotheca]|uniref:Nitronate monooxygenase domain-containing protein n=1 Tax=Echria macrotheca TaxID=438768 RepID=A0AAJ0B765_9PEZI|nr:hypothetical protein QBC47DRAFT_389275 [Echria macrotheca]
MHRSIELGKKLAASLPWTKTPLIIGAPMRVFTGPETALAIFRAGGLGFIGPGTTPQSTSVDLEAVRSATSPVPIPPRTTRSSTSSSGPGPDSNSVLPVGVGFQIWNGDLPTATAAVESFRPAAAWLFAPRNGQTETDVWTTQLRGASPHTQIWLQVGTVREALEAARSRSPPDVLVIQGAEAGGHGRAVDGAGIITLIPEIADELGETKIPLVAAGGIADGRGVVAALGVGAAGVAMGTRFLASTEARVNKGYRDEVLRARDGAASTVRTQLYNHLRGTFGWPEQWSPRTVVNRSWVEHVEGVSFEELKRRHDQALKDGAAWGPEGRTATYAGVNVGLVREVKGAGEIVEEVRREAMDIIRGMQSWVE